MLSGAERIVPIEQLIDESAGKELFDEKEKINGEEVVQLKGTSEWDKICFYIAPIGNENSEERKHSDLFLESIASPVIEGFVFS